MENNEENKSEEESSKKLWNNKFENEEKDLEEE